MKSAVLALIAAASCLLGKVGVGRIVSCAQQAHSYPCCCCCCHDSCRLTVTRPPCVNIVAGLCAAASVPAGTYVVTLPDRKCPKASGALPPSMCTMPSPCEG